MGKASVYHACEMLFFTHKQPEWVCSAYGMTRIMAPHVVLYLTNNRLVLFIQTFKSDATDQRTKSLQAIWPIIKEIKKILCVKNNWTKPPKTWAPSHQVTWVGSPGFLCRRPRMPEFIFLDCHRWIAKRKTKSSAIMLNIAWCVSHRYKQHMHMSKN